MAGKSFSLIRYIDTLQQGAIERGKKEWRNASFSDIDPSMKCMHVSNASIFLILMKTQGSRSAMHDANPTPTSY